MKITVILCTYNRCQSLARTLESVATSVLPESVEWEVLVVDNNSRDQTREVIEGYCRRFSGRFRYIHESKQGLSHARNAGIREARGDILAFTDDDIIVDNCWLRRLTGPLSSGRWAGAGGCILAANDFDCPKWLALEGEYNLGGVLALYNPADPAGDTKRPPVGANMAYRAEVFQKHGPFRTDLGRSGDNMLGNEDTELAHRLLAGGERLWYEPSAIVYHGIPENRLSKPYFLDFWFNYGRAAAREHANRSDVWRIPRWCFSIPLIVFNVLPARLRIWLLARDPKRRFFFKCTVWRTFGEIVELPRLWFGGRRLAKKGTSKGSEFRNSDVTLGE